MHIQNDVFVSCQILKQCFIPLENRVNHMSPRTINGEASLQLNQVLENTQKQSYIVSVFKDPTGLRSEEWAATKFVSYFSWISST